MGLKTGVALTSLGKANGLIIETVAANDDRVSGEIEMNEALKGQINDQLIDNFRRDLGYIGVEPDWVELRTTLTGYLGRMDNDFILFPKILNFLRAMAHKGFKKSLIAFLEMADEIPLDLVNLEFFLARLLTLDLANPLKNPLAVLMTLQKIEVNDWREAVWYLDLMISTDLTMAELAAMYLEQWKEKPPIYTYFILQIAKTGRLEALDKFADILPKMELSGGDIGIEVKPILDLIAEGKMAEAELYMLALQQMYQGGIGVES